MNKFQLQDYYRILSNEIKTLKNKMYLLFMDQRLTSDETTDLLKLTSQTNSYFNKFSVHLLAKLKLVMNLTWMV